MTSNLGKEINKASSFASLFAAMGLSLLLTACGGGGGGRYSS